jgi:hypothetical protein
MRFNNNNILYMSIKYTIDYIESIIDKQIGKGNQGTVFSLINDPDKVIKISK